MEPLAATWSVPVGSVRGDATISRGLRRRMFAIVPNPSSCVKIPFGDTSRETRSIDARLQPLVASPRSSAAARSRISAMRRCSATVAPDFSISADFKLCRAARTSGALAAWRPLNACGASKSAASSAAPPARRGASRPFVGRSRQVALRRLPRRRLVAAIDQAHPTPRIVHPLSRVGVQAKTVSGPAPSAVHPSSSIWARVARSPMYR